MQILTKNWKSIALKAKTMWYAYLGIAFGLVMQVPELAVHLQSLADALGIHAQGARWIAVLSAVAALLRVMHQKDLSNG